MPTLRERGSREAWGRRWEQTDGLWLIGLHEEGKQRERAWSFGRLVWTSSCTDLVSICVDWCLFFIWIRPFTEMVAMGSSSNF